MPAGNRVRSESHPGHPGPNCRRFSRLSWVVWVSRLLEHVLATADCHAVPVQGLFLPDVPLEMIGRISSFLRSDHAPFWREGIPALMWTDTAEFRNPHYHLPTDTPETLDYEFLAGVTRLLVHAVLSSLTG